LELTFANLFLLTHEEIFCGFGRQCISTQTLDH